MYSFIDPFYRIPLFMKHEEKRSDGSGSNYDEPVRRDRMIRLLRLILAAACLFICCFTGKTASALDPMQNGRNTEELFGEFCANAEGRYFMSDADGYRVLELIPVYGRLFASAALYMESGSLYSYYAAELIPVCLTQTGGCTGMQTAASFDLEIRIFSNMSYAGNYWPGETRQRLTLVSGDLLLSDFSGDGDALISKSDILLSRNDTLPSLMTYGPRHAEMFSGIENKCEIPVVLCGDWTDSWNNAAAAAISRMSLNADGNMTYLQDNGTDQPPLLLKGGFILSEDAEYSYSLCYLMSSPASGMMPYTGCAAVMYANGMLYVTPGPSGADGLLLPKQFAGNTYYRDLK